MPALGKDPGKGNKQGYPIAWNHSEASDAHRQIPHKKACLMLSCFMKCGYTMKPHS